MTKKATPASGARFGEWLYRAGAKLAERVRHRPVVLRGTRVVSVGNLEVGGGGKTPCVLWWADALARRGVASAVVARPWGPKTPSGVTDEVALLQERLPHGVSLHTSPNKSEAARRASAAGAQVVVVDDGFSHRRLARDLDLLLLDARHPFGNGHCLPAGPLREPPEACRRADAVVLTRADRADLEERHKTREWLHAAGYEGPVLLARHRVLGVREAGEVRPASGLAVYCVSGIGRPGELAQAAGAAGLCVRGAREFPDHHAFTSAEWKEVAAQALSLGARLLVTAKDAVRLPAEARAQVLVLEIAWDWMEGDLDPERLVDRALAPREAS
ncbi:MAG TPA: tetraacyldisaccharide 4'-kinase [Candidatus Eisenbacteria bacterium]|nr:tetraacyldisaccharide 4'-kinase [Candidatus Eisenbacteria bacterium]